MKFEYKLDYDFVKEELSFQVTKFEESLRDKNDITIIDGWKIKSFGCPEIRSGDYGRHIYLPGVWVIQDKDIVEHHCCSIEACEIANVLKKFQAWVEETCSEPVEMTIKEIEEKLGVHNLKIIKE